MANASTLQNLIKNVGCAIGTLSVCVFVSRYSKLYQSYLVDKLSLLNDAFVGKFTALAMNFAKNGADFISAQNMSDAMLYNQLIQQSALCAFMHTYMIYAIIMLIISAMVLILKKVRYDN